MKDHEFVAPWALWALSAYGKSEEEARALARPQGFGEPPHRYAMKAAGVTRNVKGLSLAARLRYFKLLGAAADFAAAKADMLDWYKAEAEAHYGIETNCPEPHRSFYYHVMVVARQVAVESGDRQLLAASAAHWGAERTLLEALDGPGGVFGACFRSEPRDSVPDFGQCDWVLGYLRGRAPRGARLAAEKGLAALGAPGWCPSGAPLRLGTPIRRVEWPGQLVTTELDPAQMPGFVIAPVLWTAVDPSTGARTPRREGRPPVLPGTPQVTIIGGEWRGPAIEGSAPEEPQPSPPPEPPVSVPGPGPAPIIPGDGGPAAAELQAIATGIAGLRLARSQHPLQNRLVAELRAAPPLDRPAREIAAEVATFGIGPGQAQHKDWRALIARLEAL